MDDLVADNIIAQRHTVLREQIVRHDIDRLGITALNDIHIIDRCGVDARHRLLEILRDGQRTVFTLKIILKGSCRIGVQYTGVITRITHEELKRLVAGKTGISDHAVIMGHTDCRSNETNEGKAFGDHIGKNAVFDRIGIVLLCDLQCDQIELLHIAVCIAYHIRSISAVLRYLRCGFCQVNIRYRHIDRRHAGIDRLKALVRCFDRRLHNIIEGMCPTGQRVKTHSLVARVQHGIKLAA